MLDNSEGNEEFKRIEQHRLNAMLGLCEITTCRRHALLGYFDEVSPARCGNCDTCLSPVDTWDGTEACRKALSAIYRTGQRFGVNHVIDVLRGTATDKVSQFDHQQLPVFGLGTDLDASQWRSVFRQLVARGLVSVNMEAYGALQLEEKSRPVLRSEESVELRHDAKASVASPQTRTAIPEEIDVEIWEALRECRRELAEAQGVPPYVIFKNATLQAMAEQMPQTIDEFSRLSGVGDRKRDKYGPAFLNILRQVGG
jgi:ATP-dependent DNA helicase RecQ